MATKELSVWNDKFNVEVSGAEQSVGKALHVLKMHSALLRALSSLCEEIDLGPSADLETHDAVNAARDLIVEARQGAH